MKKETTSEKVIHQQVCSYLDMQYPNVIYTSDMSGMRVSIGLRIEMKKKRCKRYKIPDLIILAPSGCYHGLVIEIKRDNESLTNKQGVCKNDHIRQQSLSLLKLNEAGYNARFGFGFDHCKKIIDEYFAL